MQPPQPPSGAVRPVAGYAPRYRTPLASFACRKSADPIVDGGDHAEARRLNYQQAQAEGAVDPEPSFLEACFPDGLMAEPARPMVQPSVQQLLFPLGDPLLAAAAAASPSPPRPVAAAVRPRIPAPRIQSRHITTRPGPPGPGPLLQPSASLQGVAGLATPSAFTLGTSPSAAAAATAELASHPEARSNVEDIQVPLAAMDLTADLDATQDAGTDPSLVSVSSAELASSKDSDDAAPGVPDNEDTGEGRQIPTQEM